MKRMHDQELPATSAATPVQAGVLSFPAVSQPASPANAVATFDALYKRMARPLCELARYYRVDRDDALDIVQTALFDVWRKYLGDPSRPPDPELDLDRLLTRIVVFRVRDFRRNRRTMRENLGAYFREVLNRGRARMRTDDAVEDDTLGRAIDAGIAAMSPRCRELYLMHVQGGMSIADIVRVTGVTRRTVRSMLERANTTLIHHLQRAGYSAAERRLRERS